MNIAKRTDPTITPHWWANIMSNARVFASASFMSSPPYTLLLSAQLDRLYESPSPVIGRRPPSIKQMSHGPAGSIARGVRNSLKYPYNVS